jgi:hypothetical protein
LNITGYPSFAITNIDVTNKIGERIINAIIERITSKILLKYFAYMSLIYLHVLFIKQVFNKVNIFRPVIIQIQFDLEVKKEG